MSNYLKKLKIDHGEATRIAGLRQGAPEWHEHRAKHNNSSEASAALGFKAPGCSQKELLDIKKSGAVKPDASYFEQKIMDDGHKFEALSRAEIEEEIGEDLFPTTVVREIAGMPMSASLDGETMGGEIIWEHKTLNDELRAALAKKELPDAYWPQVCQAVIVSGADRALFTARDRKTGEKITIEYYPTDEHIINLITGWKRFNKKLEKHEVKEAPKQELVAKSEFRIGALSANIKAELVETNFFDQRDRLMEALSAISTKPVTDEDFAVAKQTVKGLLNAEKSLAGFVDSVLSQSVDLNKLIDGAKNLAEVVRQKRLHLDRAVKDEERARKAKIVRDCREYALSEIRSGVDEAVANHLKSAPGSAVGQFVEHIVRKLTSGTDLNRIDVSIKGKQLMSKIEEAAEGAAEQIVNEAFSRHDLAKVALNLDKIDEHNNSLLLKGQAVTGPGAVDLAMQDDISFTGYLSSMQIEHDKQVAEIEERKRLEAEKAAAEAEKRSQDAAQDVPTGEEVRTGDQPVKGRWIVTYEFPSSEMRDTFCNDMIDLATRLGGKVGF